jgi:hypothetical protein
MRGKSQWESKSSKAMEMKIVTNLFLFLAKGFTTFIRTFSFYCDGVVSSTPWLRRLRLMAAADGCMLWLLAEACQRREM